VIAGKDTMVFGFVQENEVGLMGAGIGLSRRAGDLV
jgi:hypothetical protein